MERRLVLTIFVLAALALASQLLVWLYAGRERSAAFVGPPRSDYTLTNFSVDALDADGQHSFTIVAPWLVRKEEDGSIYVTTPQYEIIDSAGNVWQGTSDSAWINKDGTVMRLEGAVRMHRLPTPKADAVEVLTSDLTVTTSAKDKTATTPRPKQKRMETEALATVIDPNHVAHGVGMKAELAGLKNLEFLSDVHWIVQPQNHAPTRQ
jgi:lipopolysaccharide export system protein LptC